MSVEGSIDALQIQDTAVVLDHGDKEKIPSWKETYHL
jgi:hypothetical protein